jgi:hypothetical protein
MSAVGNCTQPLLSVVLILREEFAKAREMQAVVTEYQNKETKT